MGFCRRCGNIVSDGPFCKCGGTAVAGLVANRVTKSPSPDRWSQIYTRTTSPTRSAASWDSGSTSSTSNNESPVRRITALSTVGVHSSILASKSTPSSPLKASSFPHLSPQTPEADDAADITLTNIFGSMLQDSKSFTKHSCAECADEFAPDSVIYPHPAKVDAGDSYLCYTCFLLNDGSKGECGSCGRPVLILKAEGKFVKYADRFWHASCFRCRGCFKDLSSEPAVDLLGMPCCPSCFDTCATQATETKKTFERNIACAIEEPTESEIMVEELMQKLQGCSPSQTPKKGHSRRLSSARNSPSTTPVRSARRISSKGEHKQSPRNISGQSPPKNENTGSPVKRFAKPTLRALDRDVFGPLQVNGVSLESKRNTEEATVADNTAVEKKPLSQEEKPQVVASRFGTSTTCPGCQLAVSPMERGVVPGPQGTRWHSICLVCGGKQSQVKGQERGCRKKLDSSAKTDKAGRLFCRNCLNEMPRDMRPSPQTSPIRSTPLNANHTGSGTSIFASRGSGMSTLVKQMTGNGIGFNPTRSLARSPSPTLRNLPPLPDSPTRVPTVTRHITGGNITKLTRQLTGNGLTFLSGGDRPLLSEVIPVTRSVSPELGSLDTVAEEQQHATGQQNDQAKFIPPHSRSMSKGSAFETTRQIACGSTSPTRQLTGGSISPTRTAFSRRPKSLLGSRHGHHKSLDEREGRGMFLVRQMTGNAQ